MKVLMLHDCSCVGSNIKREIESSRDDVVIDHFFYHNSKLGFNLSKLVNLVSMFVRTVFCRCDFIHVHYLGVASYCAFLSGKNYILHVHGSDVRNKHLSFFKKMILNRAKFIFYATVDLKNFLPHRAIYIPIPVGKQFRDFGFERIFDCGYRILSYEKPIKLKNCFYFSNEYEYSEMPIILNNIKIFYDRISIPTLSTTALESLACGCIVNNNGEIIDSFPDIHRVKNVANLVLKYYDLM